MVNLFLNVCQARACASRSASGLRMVERAGVAGKLSFGERVLWDDFRWAL